MSDYYYYYPHMLPFETRFGKHIGYGSTRMTFAVNDRWVLKVQKCPGDRHNRREREAYLKARKRGHIGLAACRLITLFGVPECLLMERLSPLPRGGRGLDVRNSAAVSDAFDGTSDSDGSWFQGGFDRRGKLCLWDYDFEATYCDDIAERLAHPVLEDFAFDVLEYVTRPEVKAA